MPLLNDVLMLNKNIKWIYRAMIPHVYPYSLYYIRHEIYFMVKLLVLKLKNSFFHAHLFCEYSVIETVLFLFIWIVKRAIIWEMKILGEISRLNGDKTCYFQCQIMSSYLASYILKG